MGDTKRAYNLGLKAVREFETLSEEVVAYYRKYPDQIPNALARGFAILKVKQTEPILTLAVVATDKLGRIADKKTTDCFTNNWRWTHGYRDGTFDDWLRAHQLAAKKCVVASLAPSRNWTFAEGVAKVLGVNANTPIATLGQLLIKRGHTLTLAQVDAMVPSKRLEGSIFACQPRHSFFFVETGNSEDPVAVGDVRYEAEGDYLNWFAYIHKLGCDEYRSVIDRLLIRDLNATKFRT